MRLLFPLILVMLFACAHKPEKSTVTPPGHVNWGKLWVQNGCNLYNWKWKRELKVYPGQFCIFLEDGSFLSATGTSLKRFSPSKEILWEVPGHFHHQLNLTPDKKRILALSSSVTTLNGLKVRNDAFLIFDLNGKLLHRAESPGLLKHAGAEPLDWKETKELIVLKADYESSHFNSFYEIPENAYSKSVPWMKEGNFILNSTGLGIFIVSPDLSKLLKFFGHNTPGFKSFHDVQVSPDGTILYFNNANINPDYIRFSTIQKFDPVTEKITMEFRGNPKEIFYSPACGGVQEVGDLIFFSHITAGGFLWSPSKNEMVKAIPGTTNDPRGVTPTQQLKLVDVEEFFKNSK